MEPQDIAQYPHPSVTVDVVALTVVAGELRVLVHRRPADAAQAPGEWALPGVFVRIDEALDAAVRRALADKAGVRDLAIEQLATFGAPDRDPRGRVISVVYAALAPEASLRLDPARPDVRLAAIVAPWPGDTPAPAGIRGDAGANVPLAFDHAEMVGTAVARLRGKAWYRPSLLGLLPPAFSLADLEAVYEAVLGRPLATPAFRRRILDSGLIAPTTRTRTAGGRPARLYEAATPAAGDPGSALGPRAAGA